MTQASHPRQNGILWVTNSEGENNELTLKEYEDPVNQTKSPSKFKTPEKSRNDDTLTMHTMDIVSNLKRSVIAPNTDSRLKRITPAKHVGDTKL